MIKALRAAVAKWTDQALRSVAGAGSDAVPTESGDPIEIMEARVDILGGSSCWRTGVHAVIPGCDARRGGTLAPYDTNEILTTYRLVDEAHPRVSTPVSIRTCGEVSDRSIRQDYRCYIGAGDPIGLGAGVFFVLRTATRAQAEAIHLTLVGKLAESLPALMKAYKAGDDDFRETSLQVYQMAATEALSSARMAGLAHKDFTVEEALRLSN